MHLESSASGSPLDDCSIESIEIGALRDRAEGMFVMATRISSRGAGDATLHDQVLPDILELAARTDNDGDALLDQARSIIDDIDQRA
jgi:hypothetical protein